MRTFDKALLDSLIGSRVKLPRHFEGQVVIESARVLGSGVELRVRLASGHLEEAVLGDDVAVLLDTRPGEPETLRFQLTAQQLQMRHFGTRFDEKDVRRRTQSQMKTCR